MYGKHHSKEFIERITLKNRGSSDKLTVKDVSNIKMMLVNGIKQKDIAEKYNVHISTISKIFRCGNWEWVEPELNDKMIKFHGSIRKNKEIKIIELSNQGKNIREIAEYCHFSTALISKVLKSKITQAKDNRLNIKANVLFDYESGLSKETIIKKHKISKTTFQRVVVNSNRKKREDAEKAKKRNELILKTRTLKEKGMTNKDIAKILNINRCTVTEYLKIVNGSC